jgi:hypothetical protein
MSVSQHRVRMALRARIWLVHIRATAPRASRDRTVSWMWMTASQIRARMGPHVMTLWTTSAAPVHQVICLEGTVMSCCAAQCLVEYINCCCYWAYGRCCALLWSDVFSSSCGYTSCINGCNVHIKQKTVVHNYIAQSLSAAAVQMQGLLHISLPCLMCSIVFVWHVYAGLTWQE